MRGKWYTGTLLVNTLRKNMDIGLDAGYVSPIRVPGLCDYVKPELLSVPSVDILSKYGFSMEYKIYPNEWEKGKILGVIYPDGKGTYAEPYRHYSIFMEYIRKQAVEEYNYIIE